MNQVACDSILDIVGSIGEFVLEADAANAAIAGMAKVLNSDKAMLARLCDDRRRDVALGFHGVDREYINRILREREDPESFLSREAHWKLGSVTTDQDCTRGSGPSGDASAPQLIHPHASVHTLVGIIDMSTIHNVLLWFHRDRKHGPFSRDDREFFAATMPHWQRAFEQKLSYDYHYSALTTAGMIMDESPFGLFIVGAAGNVLYMNETAQQQVKAGAGISVRKRNIKFSERRVRDAFQGMLAAANQGANRDDPRMQPISFDKSDGSGSYQLGMRRMQMPPRRGTLAPTRQFALFIYDTAERMQLSVAGLKSLYGLTDAEARVCDLLYQSRNLPEAAKILGISINTAKTHLTRSYRKVGVQSQAELVRRLNSQLYVS